MYNLRKSYKEIYQSQLSEAHYNPATGEIQAEKPTREEIAKLAKAAAASGLKKRKPVSRNNPTFKPSSREQAQADMKSWASYFGGSNNEESVYDDLYNFIIESLIEGRFVQDYESAEQVIENMSDAWLETIADEWKPVSRGAIDKLGGVGNIKTGDMLNKARYTTSKGGEKPTSTTLRKRQEAQAKEAGLPPHRGQKGKMKKEYAAAAADVKKGNSSGPAAAAGAGDQKPSGLVSYYYDFMSK
jgi:hypothetical protein